MRCVYIAWMMAIQLLASAQVFAQNTPVFELPLGIKLGETKSDEISKIGVCQRRLHINQTRPCIEYRTRFGFIVKLSPSETVSHVQFKDRYPRAWQMLGIDKNMSLESFTTILEEKAVEYKLREKLQVAMHPDKVKVEYFQGNLVMLAHFTKAHPSKDESPLLVSIIVSETF